MSNPHIVLFGRVPPPVQGESVMIARSLRALREAFPVTHVNAVLSPAHADIGRFEWRKMFRIVDYVAQALAARWRKGARVLYYFPAPPKRIALFRDLLVLGCCRPFFPQVILHWQSSGLGAWLADHATAPERLAARFVFGGHTGSVVTTEYDRTDAARMGPRAIIVVPNSVEDPCPDFDGTVLPERRRRREARLAARAGGEPLEFRILYLSLCLASKGLFCALDAAQRLAAGLSAPAGARVTVDVCGEFYDAGERERFDAFCAALTPEGPLAVRYHGFVEAAEKDRLFRAADAFVLPTRYPGEAFPVALVEAMAYGLPIVTTAWKGIPSVLPPGYFGICAEQSADDVAARLGQALEDDGFAAVRAHFLAHFEFTPFSQALVAGVRELLAR